MVLQFIKYFKWRHSYINVSGSSLCRKGNKHKNPKELVGNKLINKANMFEEMMKNAISSAKLRLSDSFDLRVINLLIPGESSN